MAEYEQFYERRRAAEAAAAAGAGAAGTGSRIKEAAVKTVAAPRGQMDMPFLLLTIIILCIGLIMELSASFARAYFEFSDPTKYFIRQLLFSVLGIALMLLTSRINVNFMRRMSMPFLIGSLLLLAVVPIIGTTQGGAKRWIDLGITNLQPSELVKLAVVLSFAAMACKFKSKMSTFRYGVVPFVTILGIIIVLLLLEPHLSASIIMIAIGAIMMFLGGTKLKWFGIVAAVVLIGGILVVTQMDYAQARIDIWQHPEADPQGDGFQILQSLYAIGSGGLLGVGLGQSRQKYMYLPEEHNDYIFSIVCEELGYIGAILILLLFAMLIVRGFWLAAHARDRYGMMVMSGVSTLLFLQVFLNVAVVTNLIPCTGISLPFFSYGGSALCIQLIEMGIVLAVSRDIPAKRPG